VQRFLLNTCLPVILASTNMGHVLRHTSDGLSLTCLLQGLGGMRRMAYPTGSACVAS
jgi:hypothetical protein